MTGPDAFRPRRPEDFDALYERGCPPWDIGRPQRAFLRLAEDGAFRGRMLDVGCGTGEHALLAASMGLEATGVSGDIRVHDLSDDDLVKLRDWIDATYRVEGDLRREIQADIRRKVEIGSYQGIRHRRGLPVHGQRTQTNARTRKGRKKTVAGKKKAGKK